MSLADAARKRDAGRYAALAHPARLAIIRRLACQDACCCKEVVDALDLAQSTVSQHLKVLVESGLVDFRPERPRSRYTLNRTAMVETSAALGALVESCCLPPAKG